MRIQEPVTTIWVTFSLLLMSSLVDAQPLQGSVKVTSFEGRTFHLYCAGQQDDRITVVLDGGAAHSSVHYRDLVEQLGSDHHICAFDRPGYGFSSSGKFPRSPERNGVDIAFMLEAANIKTPVILAGHSLGGLNVLAFAVRFRELVRGIVLIDSAHPEQYQRLPPIIQENKDTTAAQYWQHAALLAIAKAEDPGPDNSHRGYPPLAAKRIKAETQLAGPERFATIASELDSIDSAAEFFRRNLARPLSMPLVVLSAANSFAWFATDETPSGQQQGLQLLWNEMQLDLLNYSTQSTQLTSTGHHALQLVDPKSINRALDQIVTGSGDDR